MTDLSKTQKAKIERGLEKIIATRTAKMADILTENSQGAYTEGDTRAQKALRVQLNTRVVSAEAYSYAKEYGSLLKKEGNIMIPVYKELSDGAQELTGYTKYNLMKNSATQDKNGIMKIIKQEYLKGTPTGLKESMKGTYPKDSMAQLLQKHHNMTKSHASLVARTEAHRITDQSQRIRYQKLGIKYARWKTAGDGNVRTTHTAREEHGLYEMDKIPSLGEPNCRCTIVPVLNPDEKDLPKNPPPDPIPEDDGLDQFRPKKKNPLTATTVAPDEESLLARTGGATRYTASQARQKVLSSVTPQERRVVTEISDDLEMTSEAASNAYKQANKAIHEGADDATIRRLVTINNDLADEANDLKNKLREARETMNVKPHAIMKNEVKNKNIGIEVFDTLDDPVFKPSDEMRERIDKANDFLQNFVQPKKHTTQDDFISPVFHNERGGRAYARQSGIFIPSSSQVDTIVHESGHVVEHIMSIRSENAFREAIHKHIASRTAGENWRRMNDLIPGRNYRVNEIAKKDKLIDPYMGKYYGTIDAERLVYTTADFGVSGQADTEFISMGLEWMYRDPAMFAEKDPKSFEFIYSLMKGLSTTDMTAVEVERFVDVAKEAMNIVESKSRYIKPKDILSAKTEKEQLQQAWKFFKENDIVKDLNKQVPYGTDWDRKLGIIPHYNITKAQKMHELPTRVSQSVFEDYPGEVFYRGVKESKYVDAFANGDYYSGKGVYGSGSYFAYGKEGLNIATGYSAQFGKVDLGSIIKCKLRSDAKVINLDDLLTEIRTFIKTMDKEIKLETDPVKSIELHRVRNSIVDVGTYASMRGYDAIEVTRFKFRVILNRGATIMEDVLPKSEIVPIGEAIP